MIWQDHVYLMVDPSLVVENDRSNLVREEAFRREGGPAIALADRSLNPRGQWDQLQVKLVHRVGGRYRMWYQLGLRVEGRLQGSHGRRMSLYYAESEDGITFKAVRTNREKGRQSNEVYQGLNDSSQSLATSGYFVDPLDQAWPYKCVVYRPGAWRDLEPGVRVRYPDNPDKPIMFIWGIGRSRDGIEWELPDHEHNLIHAMPEGARLHRAIDGGLVLADQMVNPMADWAYRNVKGWITYDLRQAHRIADYIYSMPQHMVRCQASYTGSGSAGLPWIQPHVGVLAVRKGPTMLGLTGYLYGATGYETFAQSAEIGLACSSTGVHFQDVWPFMPFIRRGHRGQWDAGLIRHDAIIDHGQTTRFYYTGNDVGNLGGRYQASFATIPRDRYGYRLIQGWRDAASRDRQATFTLKPCTLPAKPRITLNVTHVSDSRDVRLELRDAQGKPLRGFTFKDCKPVTREGFSQPVNWNKADVLKLAGREVQIAVMLRSAACGMVGEDSPRLYAISTGS